MREFLEVFKYTFKENIKRKSFIISTIIILVVVTAMMVLPAVVTKIQTADNKDKNKDIKDSDKSIVYILDKTGYFKGNLEVIQQQLPEYIVKLGDDNNVESIKKDIQEKGISYLLIANLKEGVPSLEYYTQQYDDGPDTDTMSKIFKNIYAKSILKQSNVSNSNIDAVLNDLKLNTNELGKNKMGAFISSIAIVIILFFAVYFYGYWVSMSVASEKTSRVMELLVTSVKPSRIILGKTAGMGAVGLLQLAIIMVFGILTYSLAFPGDFNIGGMKLDFSNITPFSLTMMIIYFILGYSLYALMYAVVGATVSKAEDINSAITPMSFVSVGAFYFSYGTFAAPDSVAARIGTLIPFTSPFSVPSRLVSTNVPAWEIALSLLILVATTIVIGMLSIKLYSFAVLHYGDRLKLSKLFNMSKGNKTA